MFDTTLLLWYILVTPVSNPAYLIARSEKMKLTKKYKSISPAEELRMAGEYIYLRTTTMRGGCLESGGYIDRVYRCSVDLAPVANALVCTGSSAPLHLADVVRHYGTIVRYGDTIN